MPRPKTSTRGAPPTGKPGKSRKEARKQERAEKKHRKAAHYQQHATAAEKPKAKAGKAAAPAAAKPAKRPAPDAAAPADRPAKRSKTAAAAAAAPAASSSSSSSKGKKPASRPTTDADDTAKMIKLASKDPALFAKLRESRVIPASAPVPRGLDLGFDRDEAIDRMDIDRYERLLKLKKRKSAAVPQKIAEDGLGDLYEAFSGVTAKGDTIIHEFPEEDVPREAAAAAASDDDEDCDEAGSGSDDDDDAGLGSGAEFDSDEELDSDAEEWVSDDDDEEAAASGSDDDDAAESKYLDRLGLGDLEGMLAGGADDDQDEDDVDFDDGEDMDSDLEAEMRELMGRAEYRDGLPSNEDAEEEDGSEGSWEEMASGDDDSEQDPDDE
ncbi:hypothetical protein H9P43_000269 [Blastocladiella emersonii ATCC 22665]|nr:hypothetical protein H9P43_000269 [Blastocladiella emersonii ATCC 22665]